MCLRFLLILLLSSISLDLSGQEGHLKKEIKKIISYETDIDWDVIPGMIIGIIDGDSTFVISIGNKAFNKKDTLVIDDKFEVGSLTKIFTSSLILNLVLEGRINYNDEVNNFLPKDFKNTKLDSLTINDLLNHYSYFPRLPRFIGKKQKDINNPYESYTKIDLLQYYKNFDPVNKKKSFTYSHINYALLEIVVENISGQPFHELLPTFLASKYNMLSTYIIKDSLEIVPGYNFAGKLAKPWIFNSFAGSEGIKSCLHDLNNYAKSMLDENHQFSLHHPYYTEYLPTDFDKKILVANGWYVVDQGKNYNIYTHTGRTSGHSAFIALVRETKTAVVILSNSGKGTENLGFHILRMINYNWKRKSQ